MSLDYVKGGEPVRAGTINSLIDAVGGGGNQSPDFMFTGTPYGPQVVAPTQMGNSDIQRQCMFDVRNYILSGWPMAQIQLGFSLNDALESIKVHDEEGATNATSAVMIFKNSSNCPFGGGTLSGYVLSEDDFTSQGYNNTGWVKTKMEGVFGKTSPKLQVWKTDDHVYGVIANTAYEETRQKLSSVLSQNGVEEQELSTMKMLQDWRLLYQTEFQSGQNTVPTGRTQMKHGQADVYDLSPKKNWRAMLKAFLGCYSVSNGEGGGRTSNWTWIIPMGPGADYNETSEGVWSTQLTYGGDPIIVKAEQGTLDANYDGSAIWIEDSDFGGDFIAFGKFTTNENGEIEPGNLWMDLSYDSYKYAVLGELNDGSGDPPESEAILGTAIRIAGCDKYKAKDDVKAFDEAHPSYVFSGTVGDLFKGTPKLDTYSQVQNGVSFNSLNWTTRGRDEQGQYAGGVTCRCMQIKDFDIAEATDPVVSSDLYLVRRFENDTSSANLVYVPMSAYETTPDSALSDAQTSSLQWLTLSTETSSNESSEVSTEVKVLEAWHFHEISDVYNDLCIALSGQEQHVMLRNATSGVMEYLQLSCLSVITDSQGMSDQKSISWLSSDTLVPLELQIYGFDTAEADVPTSADMYIARRKTETGQEVVYLPLSNFETTVDSQLSSAQTSSLQWRELRSGGQEHGEVSSKVVQFFEFDKLSDFIETLSGALSSEHHVVLRDVERKKVTYLALSALSTNVDSDGNTGQKSISWMSSEAEPRLQLYKMDEEGEENRTVALSSLGGKISLLSGDNQFVVRDSVGGEIKYMNIDLENTLSDVVSGLAQGVPDSEDETASTSSLQKVEISSDGDDEEDVKKTNVWQMFGFQDMDNAYPDVSSTLSSEHHLVMRNCETSAVEYIQLSALSTQVSVDSEYGGQQNEMKSIQFGTFDDDDTRYIQLYGFTEELAQADHVSVQLSTNAKPLLGEGYEFVVRKTAQNGDRTIEYKSLSAACLSGGTGGGPGQLPGPFEMSLSANGNAAFTNCVLRIARAYFFFQDQTLQVPQTDQIIYVRAEHTDPPTISVGCGDYATVSYDLGNSWSNCLSTTITPLYRTLSGDVKCDYRYMMNIQAYDAKNYSNSI